jgi:LysR family transcriptional regulator, benzoate and cis,cis-muconate-responsive activator of ben and cat genes
LVGAIPWRYRLELRQLRYFVAVARERNFTRAAAALRIAQPPLSRQIQQLEAELGVTLIERGSRPVRLTDGGRLLYEQAVQVLERVEETKAIARHVQESGRRRFSFGFVPSTLYGYLPSDRALPRRPARRRADPARAHQSRTDRRPEGGAYRRGLRSHPVR